ncbi:MAG: hypothetical protein AABO57_14265 [Acidobacteriota bacterium]
MWSRYESTNSRYSKEEFARRGDEIYDRDIKPHVTHGDDGKFVVIDIETGDYEMDRDEIVAHDRLELRRPNAQVWLTKVGRGYARRFRYRSASA